MSSEVSRPMTGKERRHLRSLGHHLRPCLQVGQKEITENVLEQVHDNLLAHELIKVKLLKFYGNNRKNLARELAQQSQAELVQLLGGSVLLYRPHPDEPKIFDPPPDISPPAPMAR